MGKTSRLYLQQFYFRKYFICFDQILIITSMLQFIYWLGGFYKTLAILSLVVFVPSKVHIKFQTQISQGFLWLYLNEMVFFFISFLIGYQVQPSYFQLAQLIVNIYFLLIFAIVFTYLMKNRKSIVSQVDILSVAFIVSSWVVFLIIGAFSIDAQDYQHMGVVGQIAYSLAWALCLIKFCVQLTINKNTTIGLNYVFLTCILCWAICQTVYCIIQTEKQITIKVTITVFGVCVLVTNVLQIIQRRQNKAIMTNNFKTQGLQRILIAQDQNLHQTHKQSKRKASTHYTGSSGDSVDNY